MEIAWKLSLTKWKRKYTFQVMTEMNKRKWRKRWKEKIYKIYIRYNFRHFFFRYPESTNFILYFPILLRFHYEFDLKDSLYVRIERYLILHRSLTGKDWFESEWFTDDWTHITTIHRPQTLHLLWAEKRKNFVHGKKQTNIKKNRKLKTIFPQVYKMKWNELKFFSRKI